MLNRNITNNSHILGISALEKIEINNSIIGDKQTGTYISSSNKLNINSTEIYAKNLTVKAKRMIVDKKSKILCTKEFDLEATDFYDFIVSSPTIICNGTTYSNLNNPIVIKTKTKDRISPLKSKRIELINMLKNIRVKVNTNNEESLKSYQEELNKKPISKALYK